VKEDLADMSKTRLYRFVAGFLIASLLAFQFACSIDRLKKPIADFEAATSVVAAQARLSYSEINRVERIRAVKTAQRLKLPLRVAELQAETTFLTGEDLAARLDALDHLGDYTKLLSQIVNSDLPEQIAKSSANLETSLNGLATRINKLTQPVAGAGAGNAASANTANFKAKFGVFTRVASEVLGLIAKKKQSDALKRAIKDGDAPVNELIDAIKLDLQLNYANKKANLEHDMTECFKAYNKEVEKAQPDNKRLEDFGAAILANLDAQEVFRATEPTAALDKMKEAHTKMVAYARDDSPASLNEALAAIQSFVGSATRLGQAVIKLKDTD
jgi:hypothetical protein